jgi:hypothetical protein
VASCGSSLSNASIEIDAITIEIIDAVVGSVKGKVG